MCLYEIENKLSKQEIEVIKEIRKLQEDNGWGILEIIIKDCEVKRLRVTNEVKLD